MYGLEMLSVSLSLSRSGNSTGVQVCSRLLFFRLALARADPHRFSRAAAATTSHRFSLRHPDIGGAS
ncbi:hypothetical protein ACSBR2_029389 [Camellia fascicularis]